MALVAHETLAKAYLFVQQARGTSPNDRAALAANFEAAIVFARSVTFHLQAQLAHAVGFVEWYNAAQASLRADPLARFLLEQRNYVLKVGPAPVRRVISVSIVESVEVSATVSTRVIRGQPWYRRSLKVLVEDLLYPVREGIALIRQRRQERARRRGRLQAESLGEPPRHELFFQESRWAGTPALDLLELQLETLRKVVKEAADRFPSPANGEASNRPLKYPSTPPTA